jgi:hypothetical protein
MKDTLVYLLWAYALIGLLITIYGVSLIRRSRRVVSELESLAAIIRKHRGQSPPPA